MTPSLSRRLLGGVTIVTLGAWAVTAMLQVKVLDREVQRLFDGHLEDSARSVHALLSEEIREYGTTGIDPRQVELLVLAEVRAHVGPLATLNDHAIEIGIGNPPRVARSDNAPGFPLIGTAIPGFREQRAGDETWRIYQAMADEARANDVRVAVAERVSVRVPIVRELLGKLALPLALGSLGVVVLLGITVHWALRPLVTVAREVAARAPDNLNPIRVAGVPLEGSPLITALNGLLVRFRSALDAARLFTANAAHELRTPLAGIKVQAEVARSAPDGYARAHALTQLVKGVDRMTHLVSQLLLLARADGDIADGGFTAIPLADLALLCAADLEARARDENVTLMLEIESRGQIAGNRELLRLALRNLLDNAFSHCGAQKRVLLAVTDLPDGRILLSVEDDGAGIPAPDRRRALEPFLRLAGSPHGGAGLGLSIVREIARLHDAALALDQGSLGGLRATLTFPPKQAAGMP